PAPNAHPPPPAPPTPTASGGTGSVSLSWTASTDNVGVDHYDVYRSTTSGFTPSAANKVGQSTTTSYTDAGLAAGTYYYLVDAADASGNISAPSSQASAVVTADTTAPTVSLTAPANGSTVSGTITVSATASDNVAVAGVQFLLDGNNLGSEVTTSPYSVSWDTTTVSNGTHTLTARARDAAGNTTLSTAITVTISNAAGVPLTINGAQTFQTIDGFGVNINSHSWNNGELKPALDMLNDQMGATLYRVVYDMEDWESVNDNADPNTPDWTYYNALYSN